GVTAVGTATLAFVGGAAVDGQVSVQASGVTADGTTAPISVTLLDVNGNPAAFQPVSLSASGSRNTFTPSAGSTDASGVFQTRLSSLTAEAKTVTASITPTQGAPFSRTATATFVAGAPDFAHSSLQLALESLTVGSSAPIVVTVQDANGNAVV